MRERLGIIMVIMALYSPGLGARGIDVPKGTDSVCADLQQIAERLRSVEEFAAHADYSVMLPQTDVPVVYGVELNAVGAADHFSPASYLIDWQMNTPSGPEHGFSAYYPGHYYSLRGDRIREYHADWDSIPMVAGGGVQRNAQFAELLPWWLADQLEAVAEDSTYTVSVRHDGRYRGREAVVVNALQTVGGEDVKNLMVALDPVSWLPIAVVTDYNLGSLAEQTVSVDYVYDAETQGVSVPMTEEELVALYPAEFEACRESNYSVATLPGRYLPGFALPTLTGERYLRERTDAFRAPTLVVLLDPAQEAAAKMVAAVRDAQRRSPRNFDVIWVSVPTNPDEAERLVGEAREGETLLIAGRTLARDCGVSALPVAIVVGADGRVAKVLIGFNKDLATDVIQSVSLVN